MGKYLLETDDEYRVMSQVGVKQYCYPERQPHNTIWDSAVGTASSIMRWEVKYLPLSMRVFAVTIIKPTRLKSSSKWKTSFFRPTDPLGLVNSIHPSAL